MNVFEIIIKSLIICGGVAIIYLILRDPRKAIVTFFRSILTRKNIFVSIIFIPISLPVWIFDKLLNLGIYYENFEDVSKPVTINPAEFDQYVLVSLNSENTTKSILKEINDALIKYEPESALEIGSIQYSMLDNKTLFKLTNKNDIKDFLTLVLCWNYTDHKNISINAKGILLNQRNINESLFFFVNDENDGKIIGKDYTNRKIYYNLLYGASNANTVFYNYNIDHFKNFKFKKFIQDLDGIKWTKITSS